MQTFAQKPKAPQQATPAKSTIRGRAHFGQSHEVNSILHLQATIGNQAVLRLLQANAEELKAGLTGTAPPRFWHDFSRIPIHPPAAGSIQAKLQINKPGDEYEQEADRISAQVMRMPEPQIQRACACGGACPKCSNEQGGRKQVQTKGIKTNDTAVTTVPPIVQEVTRSPGETLDPSTRKFMETRFGHEFGAVRIHSDQSAGDLTHRLHARALTIGDRIFFAPNEFQPDRTRGKRLLAHELAHVVQQRRLGGALVQRSTHTGAADYHDPDNCWATPDRQPTSQVIGKIEGILEVPDSCPGTIRMRSRFQVVGDWSLSLWLGTGAALKFQVTPIGVGVGQLQSEKSVGKSSFESTVSYPLTPGNCAASFAAYVLMIWMRNGPKNFFEVKFAPAVSLDGEGRLHDSSPAPEIRVDSCGRLKPTVVETPKPLPAPFGTQPEP